MNENHTIPEIFNLSIDYDQSHENMVAIGNYSWVDSYITTNSFPIVGKGKVEVEGKLYHFDRSISSNEVIAIMRRDGWEPGEFEHLLAFGRDFPEAQLKFPIVALGSVCWVKTRDFVTYLGDFSGRALLIFSFNFGWESENRFLAIRRKPAKQ